MAVSTNLDNFDAGAAVLEQEWMITVDTPDGGVENLLMALDARIPMRQGPYDCCSFIQTSGYQRFRALEGSHAGAEGTIQQTAASQIVFSIPPDEALLRNVFDTIFDSHVNEEPTIRVQTLWGSRSKLIDDKDNPNRYWNRSDADTLHGTSTGRGS
ncbi:MAG: hypothetical protein KTR18_12750 [Acidiferrobacterales bacterium]|nr:hypothetical protein [Acidiferrobacterales bacterium]